MIARLVALLAFPLSTAAASIAVTDDAGRAHLLEAPAARVVTLSPSLAEIAFAIGAGDRIVGVSSSTDSPVEAARLPVVSSPGRIDLERVLALRPDLVLAWRTGNPARDLERLRALGVRVFVTEPRAFTDIPRLARVIGTLLGATSGGEAAALDFERSLAALPRHEGAPVPTFIEVWHQPPITVSDAHLMADVLRRCGGANVFGALGMLTVPVSKEQVLLARPRLVVATGADEERQAIEARWHALWAFDPEAMPRIAIVDPRLFHRQSLRIIEAARGVCAAVSRAAR